MKMNLCRTLGGCFAQIGKISACVVLSIVGAQIAHADEMYKATSAIALPKPLNAFAIGFDDPVIGLYLLADRTNKLIIAVNTNTNKVSGIFGEGSFQGDLPGDLSGPNGVITVNHREIWAGDGDSTVKVMDIATGKLTHTIKTGGKKRADELCFDPRNQIVVIGNDDGFISFISAKTYTVVGKIDFDGNDGNPKATNSVEQCQWDLHTGLVYLPIPEVNGAGNDSADGVIAVLDAATRKLVKTYPIPLTSCVGAQGLALGPDGEMLLGCNGGAALPSKGSKIPGTGTAIISAKDGHLIATLPNVFGADQVWYNEGDNHFIITEANNTPSQLGFVDAGTLSSGSAKVEQTLPGGTSMHAVSADPVLNQVYFPVSNTDRKPYPPVDAHLCSPFGIPDTQGCILVITRSAAK
jgi:hypothetical protein